MKILVLEKRVPDLVEDLEVDAAGTALDPDSVTLTLNEFDDHALEEALLLKDDTGGSVTVMALDSEEVDKTIYIALAKGADRAIKISTSEAVDSNLARAQIFAPQIEAEGYDLILTGVQAADDRDGQLGPAVAALLDRPCIEVVTHVTPGEGSVTVHKEYSGGIVAELEADTPAVLGIQAARQSPRYAPVSRVKQVRESTTIETLTSGGGSGGPTVSVVAMTPPETGEGAQMLDGVDELMEILEAKGVI